MARCFYCNRPLLLPDEWDGSGHPPADLATRDHIFPRCMVRRLPEPMPERWYVLNRVRCCDDCNARKGDLHPLVWLATVDVHGARERLVIRLRKLHELGPGVPLLRGCGAGGGINPGSTRSWGRSPLGSGCSATHEGYLPFLLPASSFAFSRPRPASCRMPRASAVLMPYELAIPQSPHRLDGAPQLP